MSILQCPICENSGHKEILGKISEDGSLVVLRFHKNTTKIIGREFAVICGVCNEVIFIRNKRYENRHQRV